MTSVFPELAKKTNYWFGRWVDAAELPALLKTLPEHINAILPRPFPLQLLLAACNRVSVQLHEGSGCYEGLYLQALRTSTPDDAKAMLQVMANFLQKDALELKLRAELGSEYPGSLQRRYPKRQFEAWQPAGCLVHIAPSNSFTVAALGLVEGLLAGNLNVLKVSARDGQVAQRFVEVLTDNDPSGLLKDYIAVLAIPSSEQALLGQLFGCADVVSAWGGEKAIAAVRSMVPAHARLVSWGHKVSFAYLAADSLADESALEGFVRDVCRHDQQACSSPQTLMVETDEAGLRQLAGRLAALFARISPQIAREQPDMAEQAEITTVVSVARCEQPLGLTQVIEAPDGQWRILLDTRPGLRPSPLYRTLWLKPIERSQLARLLQPMKPWLQSCGLAAGLGSYAALTRLLLSAGVTRITRPGQMLDSYLGAPHDGLYALQQFCRRVSVDGPDFLREYGQLDALEPVQPLPIPAAPILDKDGFLALDTHDPSAGLVVRSGGSSGKTAYSSFRWSDYRLQMATTADGLVAAGIEPERDRVMNLFAAGNLYGGFLSFWSILEHLGVRQLPMGRSTDYGFVAEQIMLHGVNCLVGMPSHLLALFKAEGERLRAFGGIDKIFYGGEAFSAAQLRFLTQDCGIELIRSAAYGSNDAGPMGYQCPHCTGTVHHLFTRLQRLEIVELGRDVPVESDAPGRLLLTPLARAYPRIERYEIGDMGRWVLEPCPCGRQEPRFELLGRLGDAFRIGTLMNHWDFAHGLQHGFGYPGAVQLHIEALDETSSRMDIWVEPQWDEANSQAAIERLRRDYPPLQSIADMGLALDLRISVHAVTDFVHNPVSGKLIHVVDRRGA